MNYVVLRKLSNIQTILLTFFLRKLGGKLKQLDR